MKPGIHMRGIAPSVGIAVAAKIPTQIIFKVKKQRKFLRNLEKALLTATLRPIKIFLV